jgi:hypothetical protein
MISQVAAKAVSALAGVNANQLATIALLRAQIEEVQDLANNLITVGSIAVPYQTDDGEVMLVGMTDDEARAMRTLITTVLEMRII